MSRVEHDDMLQAIPRFVSEDVVVDSVVTDLAAGIAAEHLVCADLLLAGYRAFLADQNCPYDIAVERSARLIRVQVKATRLPRPVPNRPGSGPSYLFHVRRAGKGGRRRYGAAEFDILALVALDIRCIAYMPVSGAMLQTIHLRRPGLPKAHKNKRNGNIDEYPFAEALAALQ